MKTVPNPVPQGHGLYILANPKRELLYVGSSTNLRGRAHEWRACLKRGKPEFPGDPSEWCFRVVQRTEGMSYNEIRNAERELIARAVSAGLKLVNRATPTIQYRFTLDGVEGSATFHATRLGMNPMTVIHKLRRGYTVEQAFKRDQPPHNAREQAINNMPVKITSEGNPITYAEAAVILGRHRDTLKDRLKERRIANPSLTEIDVKDIYNTPT